MSISRLFLLLLLVTCAASIQAETINCTPITSLPATITAQGVYCLTGNLSTSQTSGHAIEIDANNVTIDLNGWKVGGQGAGAGSLAFGIYSTANNVTIKNGIVRGFYWAINLYGTGAVVQDVLCDSNTYVGIDGWGAGALFEHNQVVNTGGYNNTPYGIVANGAGSTVSDNIVSGLTSASSSPGVSNGAITKVSNNIIPNVSATIEYGIYVDGANSTVRNNVVSNTALPSSGTSYGITNTIYSIAINNTVSNFTTCISSDTGSIYAQNTVSSCTTDFTGGTQGAGNSGT